MRFLDKIKGREVLLIKGEKKTVKKKREIKGGNRSPMSENPY
jgi:hypothetical protein